MKRFSVAMLLVCGASWFAPAFAAPPDFVAAAVASSDRPAADTARDALRHPAELLAFAGVKQGDSVADVMPGGGYFTRIFSKAVGQQGHVYAIIPDALAAKLPKLEAGMKALAAQPAFSNVTPLVQKIDQTAAGLNLDVAWTSNNYHDLYGFYGADQAEALDGAIFKALKPGGVFMVIDHVAKGGTSATSPTTLHRIDPGTVISQVLQAGFVLEAESPLLANPADPHTAKVFAPEIRGHTDQFVFKFRKPER
jgi:predicted methyltransferase